MENQMNEKKYYPCPNCMKGLMRFEGGRFYQKIIGNLKNDSIDEIEIARCLLCKKIPDGTKLVDLV